MDTNSSVPTTDTACSEPAVLQPPVNAAPECAKPVPMPATRTDLVFALLTFVLGYGLIYIFSSNGFNWKMPVFTAAYAVFVLLWLHFDGIRPPKESWFWLGIMLSIGIPYAFFELIPVLQFFALFAAAAYWTVSAAGTLFLNGRTSGWIAVDLVNCLVVLPFSNFGCQWGILHRKAKENAASRPVFSVFFGVILALPLLLLILPPLSRADQHFADLVGQCMAYLNGHFVLCAFRLIFAVPTSCCIFGLIYGSIRKRHADWADPDDIRNAAGHLRVIPSGTICTALFLVCLFYAVFIGLQGQYFFSAFAGIRPLHLTYAEYARQGFFELCQIAALNLIFLFFGSSLSKNTADECRTLRVCFGILSVLTLLLIATAFSKMLLYIFAYGLTVKRIVASTFLVWLAIVFSMILIRQAKKNLPLVRIAAFSGAVLFAQLCALPWQYFLS